MIDISNQILSYSEDCAKNELVKNQDDQKKQDVKNARLQKEYGTIELTNNNFDEEHYGQIIFIDS